MLFQRCLIHMLVAFHSAYRNFIVYSLINSVHAKFTVVFSEIGLRGSKCTVWHFLPLLASLIPYNVAKYKATFETIMKIHKMALGRTQEEKKQRATRETRNGRRKVLKIPIHAESTCFNAQESHLLHTLWQLRLWWLLMGAKFTTCLLCTCASRRAEGCLFLSSPNSTLISFLLHLFTAHFP